MAVIITKKNNKYSGEFTGGHKLFIQILTIFAYIFAFILLSPLGMVELRYPEMKTWDYQRGTSDLKSIFVKYLVFTNDPCSGVECIQIKCYKTFLGYPTYIGEDFYNGSLSEIQDFDIKRCVVRGVDNLDGLSKSDNLLYVLRYTDKKLELVTPTHPIEIDQIKDENIGSSNIIWDEKNKKVYISYIKEGKELYSRDAYIALVSLTTGNTLKEVKINNGYYGISTDRAFPLIANEDKSKIAIQSDYIQSITVFNSNLSLIGIYKTKWNNIEMFSDEMYSLKDFSMFLDYKWKNNDTIEYGFVGSKDLFSIEINK